MNAVAESRAIPRVRVRAWRAKHRKIALWKKCSPCKNIVGNDGVNRVDPSGLVDWDKANDAIYDWLEEKVVDHSGPLPGKEQNCHAQKDQCAQKASASGNPEDYGFTCEHQETMCNTGMPNALQDPSNSGTSVSSSSCNGGDSNQAYWDSLKTNPNYEWKP